MLVNIQKGYNALWVDLCYNEQHKFILLTTCDGTNTDRYLLLNIDLLLPLVSFAIIVLAAQQIGLFLARFNLPLISGYLLAGIIVGPFLLQFMNTADVEHLLFLDEISLAFIAFAAGSEMYLEELHGRYRSIGWNTVMQVVAVYLISGVVIIMMADTIPFMVDLSMSGKFAVALLAGTILTARSPSSAIAIINELRARGPFTKTILGVTLVTDVLVVMLFALSTSIASTLLTGQSFDIGFILLVSFELTASIVVGLLVGRLLAVILAAHIDERLKIALILIIGYLVFVFSAELRHITHDNFQFEILLEPLLICMIASFWLTNRTPYRDELRHLLHRVETPIFVIFFTLIGESLDIAIILTILPITLVIFATRLLALFIGGYMGGVFAGDPEQFSRFTWMTYITQAGVGLGLAKEVAIEFPQFGNDFTTLMVATIVLSQLVGPPFFKYAIKRVKEAHTPDEHEPDEIRDVLIVGIENQTRALADRLLAHNWEVILADIDPSHVTAEDTSEDGLKQAFTLDDISAEYIRPMIKPGLDVAVAALHDDAANLRLCEILYEEFGITRLIVRLNEFTLIDQFRELGVQVVYPANAMVHLLDSVIRAPQLATMILQDDPHQEVVQVTISEPDVDGLLLRDLIMPNDVLVMAIYSKGHSIVPHGYTQLHVDDEITLVGSPKSIDEVVLKLGY
jgi:Trk K+ transport system NAD-binding subunit/Kef-type K+ transport system membrane component KefB